MPSRPKPLPLATHGKQGLGKGRGVLAVLGLHLVFKEKNCTERPERRGREGVAVAPPQLTQALQALGNNCPGSQNTKPSFQMSPTQSFTEQRGRKQRAI